MKLEGNLRVFERHFGKGTVMAMFQNGRRAFVAFDSGYSTTLWTRDLVTIFEDGPLGKGVKLDPRRVLPIPSSYGAGDRRLIEAFRLGIVPETSILDWTYGREGELSYLSGWLEDPQEAVFYLFGDYGSGKTHMLSASAAHARKEGWAVSMVPLDPLDSPPSSPKRVYSRIVRNLVWENSSGSLLGFRELLELALGNGEFVEEVSTHPILGEFTRRLSGCRNPGRLWSWLMAEDNAVPSELPTLHDHTTASNLYCNLLTFFGYAFHRYCGVKGVLLLLDEAEMVSAVRWYQQIQRGLDFIRGLSMAAGGEEVLQKEGVKKSAGEPIYRGEKTSLVYSGHYRKLRYAHPQAAGLCRTKVIFAVTPTELLQELVEQHDFDAMDLDPIPVAALGKLFDRFCTHYRNTYGVTASKKTLDRVRLALLTDLSINGVQRRFMKSMVEAMDYLRFHGDKGLDALLGSEIEASDKRFGIAW